MSFPDIIVLSVVLALVGSIIYFRYIKHWGDHCYGCSEIKKCQAMGKALRKCRKQMKKEKKDR